MGRRISINGFEYDSRLFDLVHLAEEMEARVEHALHRLSKIALLSDARRYRICAKSQQSGEHAIFELAGDSTICNCGLVVVGAESEAGLYSVPGHVEASTKNLVTLFHVVLSRDRLYDDALKYFCQNCGILGEVPQELLADKVLLIQALDELREAHFCPKGSRQGAKG